MGTLYCILGHIRDRYVAGTLQNFPPSCTPDILQLVCWFLCVQNGHGHTTGEKRLTVTSYTNKFLMCEGYQRALRLWAFLLFFISCTGTMHACSHWFIRLHISQIFVRAPLHRVGTKPCQFDDQSPSLRTLHRLDSCSYENWLDRWEYGRTLHKGGEISLCCLWILKVDDQALLAFGVAKGTHVDLFVRSIQIHTSSGLTKLPTTDYNHERL